MIESATLELERTSAKCALQGGSPVRDDFLIFGSPLIGEDEIAEVVATLRSGWLGTGPRAHRFEEDFKNPQDEEHKPLQEISQI